MGRPPSAGLVRPKNDSMARAGPWWPMAVLDLRVGLAGKPPPALYCPSVDRLGIEAHFPAASRDRPSCRDHVAGGLALEFVGVPGGRIGHVCCLSSLRCILDDLPSGMRVRNDDTGPRPAAPGGLRSWWCAETQERGAVLEHTADPAKTLAATIAFQKLVNSIFS